MIEVPEELSILRQWVCWKNQKRGDKFTKVPCQPNGVPASTTNPATWSKIANCRSATDKRGLDGIGFVFTDNDPYSGIDLDKCIQDGKLEPWARELVDQMDSYTEFSPSGKGLHIICKARVGGNRGHRKGGIELYDLGRYFTFTGDVFENRHAINSPEDEVRELWLKLGGDNASVDFQDIKVDLKGSPPIELHTALMDNHRKFKQSWKHQRPDFKDQSTSSYDMSITAIAAQAGWSDENLALLLAAHRREWGGIEKLERGDYVGRTIAQARSGLSEGLNDLELSNESGLANAMNEGIDIALEKLSDILGTHVDGFIRRGMEPTNVYALVSGREVFWGKQNEIIRYPFAFKEWFGQTSATIKVMTQVAWIRVAKRLIDLATYEPDQSTGRVGIVLEDLRLYLAAKIDESGNKGLPDFSQDKDFVEELIQCSNPFLKEDQLYFNLLDFMRWYYVMGLGRQKRPELHRFLIDAGYQKKRVRIGKTESRSYYAGPILSYDEPD